MRLLAVLLASTAISAASTAAFADPNLVGGVAIGPTQSSGDGLFSGADISGYHVRGFISGAYNFTPVLGAQGDVLLRYESLSQDADDFTTTSLDGALHGFYRVPDSFLLGAFVQAGQDSVAFDGGDGPQIDRKYLGVEGQAFFNQFTIYGQLGLQNSSDGSDVDLDGWFITGEVRYFLTPDLKIEVHAGRSELSYTDGLTLQAETVNFGFGAEYRFAELPLSVFGQYDYHTSSVNLAEGSLDSHRVLVGLKFNMGEDSLQDRDRNGASLKPVDTAGIWSFGPGLEP